MEGEEGEGEGRRRGRGRRGERGIGVEKGKRIAGVG